MKNFNVILGINWLSRNRTTIQYFDKKLILKGLANILEKKSPKLIVVDELIVKDFLNVFPKDLPGGPPNRQVEFTIDLISKVAQKLADSYKNEA